MKELNLDEFSVIELNSFEKQNTDGGCIFLPLLVLAATINIVALYNIFVIVPVWFSIGLAIGAH